MRFAERLHLLGFAKQFAHKFAQRFVRRPIAFVIDVVLQIVQQIIGVEKPAGGKGIEFWGQSFVAGTSGQILAKASTNKEEILLVPVDLSKVDTTRTHWPFLRDRRIDAYSDLSRRFID